MKPVFIQSRKDSQLLVTQKSVVTVKGNEAEVLSGATYLDWLYPFQVAFPNPTEPEVSPVFKQSVRMVNGVQTDQFYLYGTGGFRWVNCSSCIPVFFNPK